MICRLDCKRNVKLIMKLITEFVKNFLYECFVWKAPLSKRTLRKTLRRSAVYPASLSVSSLPVKPYIATSTLAAFKGAPSYPAQTEF